MTKIYSLFQKRKQTYSFWFFFEYANNRYMYINQIDSACLFARTRSGAYTQLNHAVADYIILRNYLLPIIRGNRK